MARLQGRRPQTLQLQLLSLWVLAWLHGRLATSKPADYSPLHWNSSCNYTVRGIPASVFYARAAASSNGTLFPLSPAYRVLTNEAPTKACFGPGETYNHTLVAAGIKMPCGYAVKSDMVAPTIDYWEENACQETIATNCYCYAIGRSWHGGYCMPGYRKWGDTIDYTNCSDVHNKVVLDGGVPVSREQVYNRHQPAEGHYIALVLWPQEDFHFFRRDSNGLWSQKRGDTFVTNTFPNGSLVTDVEDPAILGAYKDFCGYFFVNPGSHFVQESYYAYQQSALERIAAVEQLPGVTVNITRLAHPSVGWARLSYPYYMFGLDAAVFEQGRRRLPWQGEDAESLRPVSMYTSTEATTGVSRPVPGDRFSLPEKHQDAAVTAGMGSTVDAACDYAYAVPERSRRVPQVRTKPSWTPWRNNPRRSWGVKVEQKLGHRHHGQFAGWRSSSSTSKAKSRRNGPSSSSLNSELQGRLRPHWMSRLQQHVPLQRRDAAVHSAWRRSRWPPPDQTHKSLVI